MAQSRSILGNLIDNKSRTWESVKAKEEVKKRRAKGKPLEMVDLNKIYEAARKGA